MSSDLDGASFSDRQKRASDAKSALLAKLRPKPTVTNPHAPSTRGASTRGVRKQEQSLETPCGRSLDARRLSSP